MKKTTKLALPASMNSGGEKTNGSAQKHASKNTTVATKLNLTDEQKKIISNEIDKAMKAAYIKYYFVPRGEKWIKTDGAGVTENEGFKGERMVMENGILIAMRELKQELGIPFELI